jgi:8-oxo-dGTP pyrophosphatase MutT (NUDIX family)
MVRISSRAILRTSDNKVLLIHRVRDGLEYYVTPGGRVEAGESPEEAVRRELLEEVGIEVAVEGLALEWRGEVNGEASIQHFYYCRHLSGTVGTGCGPEVLASCPANLHDVVAVDLPELNTLNVVPAVIKAIISRRLGDGSTASRVEN